MINLKTSASIFAAICFLFSFSAKGGIPEKLADFNLNSKRESEKTGVSFQKTTETTGALGNGIFVSDGGFISIPTYPSFRAEAMIPELNLDAECGTLEFRFSPIEDLDKETKRSILFACGFIGENDPGMKFFYKKGKFIFELRDKKGEMLKAESKQTDLKAGKFCHLALAWNIGRSDESSFLKIYLNGEKIAESKGVLDSIGISQPDFFIGSDSGKNTLPGVYDEIKIWNVEIDKFDMKEDNRKDRIKNARPIKVENFNDYPKAALVDDELFGKCFLLPGKCKINECFRPDQGMAEFWLKPMELPKEKVEICRIGKGIVLGAESGKIFMLVNGQKRETNSSLKMKKWNALTLAWNLRSKTFSLYLNGKKIGQLRMDKKIPLDSRLIFSLEKGKALLKGVRLWHLCLPEKNIYDKGLRLTGNFSPELQPLLTHDVPVILKGDYVYSKAVDGINDVSEGKGPFAFSKGKLTDGKIGVGAADRVSYYNSMEIVFDLKETCLISEILVYCASRPNWHLKDIEFFTSLNGRKWVPDGKLTDDHPEYSTHLIVPFKMKIGKKGRYIKIRTSSLEKHLTSISEVLIFGLPTEGKSGKKESKK